VQADALADLKALRLGGLLENGYLAVPARLAAGDRVDRAEAVGHRSDHEARGARGVDSLAANDQAADCPDCSVGRVDAFDALDRAHQVFADRLCSV
jgi:hypothetical protein